jgi:hypothetical protein
MWKKATKTAESLAMLDIEDVFRLYSMEYQDFNLPKPSSYKASHVFDDENKWIQKEQYIKMLNKEQKSSIWLNNVYFWWLQIRQPLLFGRVCRKWTNCCQQYFNECFEWSEIYITVASTCIATTLTEHITLNSSFLFL